MEPLVTRISSVSYEVQDQRLTVTFCPHRIVVFHDVPSAVERTLATAADPEIYFATHIRGRYVWIDHHVNASPHHVDRCNAET
jgi:hypothetical protein